ncbi:uncharacterized protein KY384_004452 [Bacidia gigantensis]|uniref:uncharacterized protein n=1 Tax=Bacidia gigantensis TaxID=2732470 RepID=UPI001D055065|nr:uncharacterized protein KY384_004452 [Bacidia gigantensis]KAG8531095.1 hypothetical protein KY384_004452 [Bacidia gigantensis]
MSSKRKKNQGENSGSNRNLDGRRLRTVNEAKALAEYLALKPDMEKKEKEARRKRWEEVVALAERKEEEIRSGAKGKVDGQWAEDKEEISERTREAVHATMKLGDYHDDLQGMAGRREMVSAQKDQKESMATAALAGPESTSKEGVATRSYMGFEEDNEFMSDSSSE